MGYGRDNWLSDLVVLVREKLLYFIVSASVVALTFLSQNTESLQTTSMLTRSINALESLSFYLAHFLAPLKMSPIYPFSSMSLEFCFTETSSFT